MAEERAVIRLLQSPHRRSVTLAGDVLVETHGILEMSLSPDERVDWALTPGRFVSIRRLRHGRAYGQVLQLLPGRPRVAIFRLFDETRGEYRCDPRHILLAPLRAVAGRHAEGRTTTTPVLVLDVSAHGAGLVAPRPLPPGTSIVLRLGEAGSSTRAVLPAQVAWSVEVRDVARLGVTFTAELGSQLNFLLGRLLRLDAALLKLLASEDSG